MAHSGNRLGSPLLCVLLCVTGWSLPAVAHSEPLMYLAAVRVNLWNTTIPYGVALSHPAIDNLPAGGVAGANGSGPAQFTLPAGHIGLMTSHYPPEQVVPLSYTQFTAANGPGSFFAGGAPGPATSAPVASIPSSQFKASFSGGAASFGGTMRLLGRYHWKLNCPPCSYHTEFDLGAIGGTFGNEAVATTLVGGTAAPYTFVSATVWGFPWTTGNVSAVAEIPGSTYQTVATAMGGDQRTPGGVGNIQLVTPLLVRVRYSPYTGGELQFHYAGTAKAELVFVPEPAALALLGSGLALLVALHRMTRGGERLD